MSVGRGVVAVVVGLVVIGVLAPVSTAAAGGGARGTVAAVAVAALADERAAPLAGLPGDFAQVMGYEPATVRLADGQVRAVKPDGDCSWPLGGGPFGFDTACRAHDLGYDLLRYAQAEGAVLGPDARRALDERFARDLQAHCGTTQRGAAATVCRASAGIYADFTAFNSWRQRHGPPVREPLTAWAIGLVVSAVVARAPYRRRTRPQAVPAPQGRDRYVDLLRVAAIVVVVAAHWFGSVVEVRGGVPSADHILLMVPQTQYLTWFLQVMPLFFMVGGYANAASWRAAREQGETARSWLRARYRRLLLPAGVLIGAWVVLGGVLVVAGLDARLVLTGARHALGPLWFLYIYVGVVAVAPVMVALHDRHGARVVAGLVALAVATEVARAAVPTLGWANAAWVWLVMHQLGVWWQDGGLVRWARYLVAGGAAAFGLIMTAGLHPVSMVDPANTGPPSVALLAMGFAHTGVVILLRPRAAGLLERPGVQRVVDAANRLVMPVYLWHVTALMLVVLGAVLTGLWPAVEPFTPGWWALRPLWIALLILATLPIVALPALTRPRARVRSRTRTRSPVRDPAVPVSSGSGLRGS